MENLKHYLKKPLESYSKMYGKHPCAVSILTYVAGIGIGAYAGHSFFGEQTLMQSPDIFSLDMPSEENVVERTYPHGAVFGAFCGAMSSLNIHGKMNKIFQK